MNLENEAKKRQDFIEILKELSTEQNTLETPESRSKFFLRLENLYWAKKTEDEFRHFYSDIFSVIAMLDSNLIAGDINTLGQNLELIRVGYKACNRDTSGNLINITKKINKLYDHVNLEISRMSYTEAQNVKTALEKKITHVAAKMITLDKKVDCASSMSEEINNNIKNTQKEFVAILGIFAAVVLAFTGGIAFSTSVLENINSVSPYRIIIVALIIGIVLINIIYSLFYYVDKIIYKKDAKLKPIVISNIILLILIASVFIMWNTGYIEKRNMNVSKNLNSESRIEEPH